MDDGIREKLDKFFGGYKVLKVKKGKTITFASDLVENIFFLKKGYVKQVINKDGECLMLTIFKPYSFFPMMLYLGEMENKYEFIAVNEVELRVASTEEVLDFIKSNPDVLLDLTIRLSKGLNGIILKLESMMNANGESKLANLLLYLASNFGDKSNGIITINVKLTHYDIASWVGMQRETVSRHLELLEKDGIIKKGKNIIILDVERLQEMSNDSSDY